ncbi:MAG: hypothetical protein PUP93_34400, partial [Rhizonema sp. NSF051]|nr:hypothetical protein [Rhizonema sp. NSF051]
REILSHKVYVIKILESFSRFGIEFTEERQRAEGSYAEGILIFDLPDATGYKAPKFIYEKKRKNVFRDA